MISSYLKLLKFSPPDAGPQIFVWSPGIKHIKNDIYDTHFFNFIEIQIDKNIVTIFFVCVWIKYCI